MITIKTLTGASNYEKNMIERSMVKLNKVWISDELKQKILSHTKLDGSLGFECTDKSNSEIWEEMQKQFFGGVELEDEVYTPSWWERRFNNRVVGYETPDGVIHQNSTFLDNYSDADICDNIAHEAMHKIGYEHNGNSPTPENLKSAPYGVGYAIQEVVDEQDGTGGEED